MKGHELIKPVLDKFPGLPEKLAYLFGKSAVWWRSHGYELRRDNPLANGNLSPVDHVLTFLERYRAAEFEAGKQLAENLISELRARFHAACAGDVSDREIRHDLFTEFFEAVRELDKSDLKQQSILELGKTDSELADIEAAVGRARSAVRAEKRRKEIGASVGERFGSNGRN